MLPRRTGPLRRANTTAGEPRTGARRSLQDRAIAAYGRAKAFRGGTYASRVAFGLCRRAGTGGQSCCLILAGTPSAKECTSADPRPLCAGISLGARQWRRRAPSRQRLNGQPAAPVEIPVPKREDVGGRTGSAEAPGARTTPSGAGALLALSDFSGPTPNVYGPNQNPSANLASSLMFSGDHGGTKTISGSTVLTPSSSPTNSSICSLT